MTPKELTLKAVADNENLFQTLKEHIVGKFDDHTTSNGQLLVQDDYLLGQIFRARLVGRELVEEAFKEIARLRTSEKRVGVVNKAR